MTKCSSLLEVPAQETWEDDTCHSPQQCKGQQEWQEWLCCTSSKPTHDAGMHLSLDKSHSARVHLIRTKSSHDHAALPTCTGLRHSDSESSGDLPGHLSPSFFNKEHRVSHHSKSSNLNHVCIKQALIGVGLLGPGRCQAAHSVRNHSSQAFGLRIVSHETELVSPQS